jgi:hypothetical protein
MAIEIKSGASSDLLTVDPVSKAIRVTNYSADGTEGHGLHPLPVVIPVLPVTTAGDDVIASTDVSEYKFVSLQLNGTFQATVKFQGSNDNGTFYDTVVQTPGILQEPYVTEKTGIGIVKIPILFKYLRVRVTAYTSGTVEGVAFAYKEANDSGQISSTGTINGTVALDAGSAVSIVGASSLTPFYAIGAVGTNQTAISAAPSILRSVVFTNLAATPRHLKLYDIATTPVAGAGTPVIVCSLAAAGTLAFPLPVEGFPFANGIGFTMVLGADNASTTPATTQPDFTVSMIYSA